MSIDQQPAAETQLDLHEMSGAARVRRVGRVRFPVWELDQHGRVLASMGRFGRFKVFLGRGIRVELADGTRWRIKAKGGDGVIAPAIVDSEKRKIALSSVGVGGYGINGRDYGCVLYRAEGGRFSRPNRWLLRKYDLELAEITRQPLSVDASEPLHLGAVLMCFALARYGILGESRPGLKINWG